jgi:hypothetical protein
MLQRRNVPFVAILGLLPVALIACSDATSSVDPRTQPPLVRVATVESSTRAERSFTGIVAARVRKMTWGSACLGRLWNAWWIPGKR